MAVRENLALKLLGDDGDACLVFRCGECNRLDIIDGAEEIHDLSDAALCAENNQFLCKVCLDGS